MRSEATVRNAVATTVRSALQTECEFAASGRFAWDCRLRDNPGGGAIASEEIDVRD